MGSVPTYSLYVISMYIFVVFEYTSNYANFMERKQEQDQYY